MTVEAGLPMILARAAADPRRRDRVAVSCQGVAWTFGELDGRARGLAAGLAAAGIGRGERVAVVMPNRAEWVELFFGITGAGAVCVPVSVLMRPPEVADVCADSGARHVVVSAESVPLLAELPDCVETVIVVGEARPETDRVVLRHDDLVVSGAPPASGPRADQMAVVYYSSGTTGRPKGAAHTHAGVLWNAFGQAHDLGLDEDDVYLVVPSLSWAAGFNNIFLALLWLGGRSVILPTGQTAIDSIVARLVEVGATQVMLVPTLVKRLLDRPELVAAVAASRLRRVYSGGEPIPRSVVERFAAALPGCDLLQAYGMSEFPTIATILRPEDAPGHAASAGRPLSHTQLAVRDAAGEVRTAGDGEILLRSPATMRGYLGSPEETARAFVDGWFASGDLGRIDEEGFLAITGRVKDMIISGGLNVYPREVEEILYRLSGVIEACVVGVGDERWGEVPAAVVVAAEGACEGEAVIAACRERLATYKCPKYVFVRQEPLPRNPSGKVLKRAVAPWIEERLAASQPLTEGVGNVD